MPTICDVSVGGDIELHARQFIQKSEPMGKDGQYISMPPRA